MRKTVGAAAALLVGATLVAGCGGKDEACTEAPYLESALAKQFNAGVTADSVQAVKSTDFQNVWLVAVKLGGSGNGAKAVFAVNSLTAPSTVLAVDNVAAASSSWPSGSAQGLSASSAGVSVVEGCL